MKNLASRPRGFLAIAFLATAFFCAPRFTWGQRNAPMQQRDVPQNIPDLLHEISRFPPDPCGPPYGVDEDSSRIEGAIFRSVEASMPQLLNGAPPDQNSQQDQAAIWIRSLEKASDQINSGWPEENRLRFQLLDLSSIFVLRVSIRSQARFFVFGIPGRDVSGEPSQQWRVAGEDEEYFGQKSSWVRINLFPLHRGPDGHARFLASFIESGCAGSVGIKYDAQEWDPELGSLGQIIEQDGSFGLDDKVAGFAQIGKLQTEGSAITLPHCWFSPIDTWDNPSLCAVDTYDLSGNDVRFQARTYNRPDLVPIAKAIEYAKQREYPAVRAYCGSSDVALSLVRNVSPDLIAEDLEVTPIGDGKERVSFGHGLDSFEVERRNGRWLVVRYSGN